MSPDDASPAEMRRPSAHPDADPLALDEATLERLLTGDLSPAQAPPGYAEVAVLLAATVAAPSPEELSGQAATLAELRAVTRTRRPAGERWRAARPRRRRRAGLAVVVVLGALATGGAAAAASGHLPQPVRDAARRIMVTVGGGEPAAPTQPGPRPAPATRTAESGGAGRGDPGPLPSGAADRGPGTSGAGSAASPDMRGLCQAYLAGQGSGQGKKLDATAFDALATAAGGPDQVPAYCQALQSADTKPKEQKQPPPDDPGQGNGQGQGGPPPSTGGRGQGPGGPPGTPSPGR